MARHLSAFIVLSLLLSGCASAPPPPRDGRFAWDGLGQDPNKSVRQKRRPIAVAASKTVVKPPDPNIEREKVLATLRPYSPAWWAVQDEIEGDEHRRINAKLVICRNCLPPPVRDDHTSSIRP